jgi:pimeloyl-ACP methyl ester carboxylesterase
MQADLVPDTIQTAGGTVRCGIWGDGPPMVLLHGTPFSSSVWREVLPGLAFSHRVFVWDMPGFGQSEQRPGQDVSLARQGRVFAQLLRHWELRSPSVVAHDVGGVVALRALLLEGSSYHELTLVDAVGVPGWSGGGFFDVTRQNPDVFSRLPGFAHRALVASKIADASHRGLRPAALQEFLHPWCGDGGQAAFYRQYAQASEADTVEIQDRLASLTVPVRILWGRQDRWLPEAYAAHMRARIPHAEFAWIDDAGHLVQEDAPAQLLAHLLRPVRSPAPGSPAGANHPPKAGP